MPSVLDPAKKGKTIVSAYDSETFDADVSIHVDGSVGSATISPSNRDVALASPEGLAIIDLDSPYSPPRRLSSHGLPWLVVDVQWSPFAARDYWVASTANHRCLIWNLNLREDSANGAIEHSLQGHSRAITDINFSAHHPDLLSTCAVDGFVHTWDLRKPRQPVLTFCDWSAGATQVKYNRQDKFILASSHDRWLHLWDERRASKPFKSIDAHTSKIYGLDWNRTRSTGIVTCSLDKTIKFWDYRNSEDKPERIIRTDFPVWRARHTPFGWGLLAMPQDDPGNLYLYDRRKGETDPVESTVEPVTVFPGHGNSKVKEFLWRSRGNITDDGVDGRDFQLVSWGEDNELRLHRVDPGVFERVGHSKGAPAREGLIITRKGATYKTYRSVEDSSSRERRSATMSDPRPGAGGAQRPRSALTMGMQTSPSHNTRATGTSSAWRGQSMKAKSAAAKTGDRSLEQLVWMKGVTMSKKKPFNVEPSRRKDSKDSTMFGHGYLDQHWGEPESWQDEIIRINQQLPNVTWKNVDTSALTLDAELKGPWGVDGDPIYIKVKVDIPHRYPKSRAPTFLIEKSALMSDVTHKKLDLEVNKVANQFAKRKQNCLEVTFCYLLGETDLSSSTSFFKNVRDLDDDPLLADESSSDSDDGEIPAGGSASMSQELIPTTELDAPSAPLNRTVVPPERRTCGARWSNDGRLICFFPSKEEKARAALFAPADSYRERSRGEPSFAGFGRLQEDSPPPKQRHFLDDASMVDDQSESESDGNSSSSSSDWEQPYMHKVNMWYLPGRRFRKTFSGTHSFRSSGGGTGIDTGTGTLASRKRLAKNKNVISIYPFEEMLPARREFAEEYAIFGDGASVCEHNAHVADRHGRPDLVHVWKYAALLLRKDIPLELLEHGHQKKSVLVIAKDLVARIRDIRSNGQDEEINLLTGRVRWGLHPLAKDFIQELFDHFEQQADIQMLAMLSCIFSEAYTKDSVAYAESNLTQPQTPLPMKAPAFSLEYFPTDASAWHSSSYNKSSAPSAVSDPKTAHTPIYNSGSYGSDTGVWPGDPGSNSYSCGDTPPARTPRDGASEGGDAAQSLSTSPEPRLSKRPNSTFTTGIPSSLTRPFSSTVSTSPPARKRPSPGETFLAATSNMVTWGSSTILGANSEVTTNARNSYSEDEWQRTEPVTLVSPLIYTEMEDQSMFDDDGWLSVPLLEHSLEDMFSSYRYAYAELLQMWDQPLARLEIMKFNVLNQDMTTTSSVPYVQEDFHDPYHGHDSISHNSLALHGTKSPIMAGRREQLQSIVDSDRGLDVVGICRIHDWIHLEPDRTLRSTGPLGGAVGTCERCNNKILQSQLKCVYCREAIYAQYVPCLACGCALHEACLYEWHSMGETECPAGDECDCVHLASDGQVETWAAMMGAVRQSIAKGPVITLDEDSDISVTDSADKRRESMDIGTEWQQIASSLGTPSGDAGRQGLSVTRLGLQGANRLRRHADNLVNASNSWRKAAAGNSSILRR